MGLYEFNKWENFVSLKLKNINHTMSKNIILTFLFSLLCLQIYAGSEKAVITGTVRCADSRPAEYITVSLKNTSYGTITDSNGNFRFEAPAGKYTMEVSSFMSHNNEFPVIIKSDKTNDFPNIIVTEKTQQLDQVVVTGQFFPQSLNRSVYKIRTINAEQIEKKAPTSVESLLNTEIGVRLSNDMALGETDFEIMGMSGNNVKVLIDGIPVVDRLSKKQSLSQIDINTIERVEIVEGPMSVTYGTDALAGVINIITKKGDSGSGKRLSVGARVQEETVGNEYNPFYNKGSHIQSVNALYNFKNGMYAGGNFTRNDFGGWQGDLVGRKKEWPSKLQYMAGVQIGIVKKNYNLIYKLDYLNEDILVKGDIPENRKATDINFLANRYTHQLQGNWEVNNRFRLSLSASYQDYHRDKESTVINFSTGEKYPSTGENAKDESNYSIWFARIAAVWKVSSKLNLQGGIEYQHSKGNGDKIDSGHNTIDNAAVFLSAEYSPFEWLDIRPGVRSSYNSVYKAPLAIPSLNAKLRLNDKMDIRASYGRGFRAPTLQELYYTFYHVNGGGFWIKGNPDLKAERSDSYMVSWLWRIIQSSDIRLTTTLSGFFNNFKDRIQMVASAEEASTETYYNTGKYQTLGTTLENTLAWKDLSATVSFSYIGRYNTMLDDENFSSQQQDRFRYSPELSVSLTYDWQKVATFNLFYKFTGSRYEYKEYNDNLVLAGLESYNWADFTVSRPVLKFFVVSAGVKNIFNVAWVKNTIASGNDGTGTSAFSPSLLGCGRSYFIGLTFKFNK